MVLRRCKVCSDVGEYFADRVGAKAKGFHGLVCWSCHMADQRSWRGTELGRQEANDASTAYRQRRKANTIGHDCARRV